MLDVSVRPERKFQATLASPLEEPEEEDKENHGPSPSRIPKLNRGPLPTRIPIPTQKSLITAETNVVYAPATLLDHKQVVCIKLKNHGSMKNVLQVEG